jgi:hypothetical protein
MPAVISTLHLFARPFFLKAMITAAGAHVHAVKNDRNWTEDVTAVGRKSVWLREREGVLLNAKERVARLSGYVNILEVICLFG